MNPQIDPDQEAVYSFGNYLSDGDMTWPSENEGDDLYAGRLVDIGDTRRYVRRCTQDSWLSRSYCPSVPRALSARDVAGHGEFAAITHCSRDTASYLNFSMATLDRWSSLGTGPRFFKIGKHRRFRLRDIQAWLEARAREQEGGKPWGVGSG